MDSITRQGIDNSQYEVILVDDGSQDNSLDICTTYTSRHANFKVYSQAHSGIGAARNYGLTKATGKYVYFLDGDDYLASKMLQIIIPTLFKEDFELIAFKSKRTRSLKDMQSETLSSQQVKTKLEHGIWQIANNPDYRIEVWWYFVKRDYLAQHHFMFEHNRFVNDSYYTPQLFINAPSVLFIPLDLHRYVFRKGSITKSADKSHLKKHIKDSKFAIEKMHSLIQLLERSNHPDANKAIQRISGQIYKYSFFSLVRLMRSKGNTQELDTLIMDLTSLDAYPIRSEYMMGKLKFLSKLFNLKNVLQLLVGIQNLGSFRKISKYY